MGGGARGLTGGTLHLQHVGYFPDRSGPLCPSKPSFPIHPNPGYHFPVSKPQRQLFCKMPHICIQEAPEHSMPDVSKATAP